MGNPCVHLNGRIVPADQAAVSVLDPGFLHGASAFTTMGAHNSVVFRLDQHLDRLMDTVRLLGLRVEITKEQLAAGVGELLENIGAAPAQSEAVRGGQGESQTTDVYRNLFQTKVRITLTPGPGNGGAPTVLIAADPVPQQYVQWRREGITVVVSSYKQASGDPTCGYKTGCYLPRVLGLREAAAKGAQEALWFTPDNRLAEACFRNVLLVLDGKVHTPPRDTPCLPGIVRRAVLDLCGQLGIPCDAETPLTVSEMLAAQEVFLTGSGIGVVPVVRIERHAVGDEKPGEMTKKIMAALAELVERECRSPLS
jgi:branched-chain amino acid aminotransferase